MAVKIEKKIVSYEVQTGEAEISETNAPEKVERKTADVIHMHERLERPETLFGSTYKVKTPLSEHALYVTINDIILNRDTEHEQRRPFEIFINSKNMDHFQWIVALTRIISAVFRKGGDVAFLVEELRSVFDPRGGYFKKGGKFMPSLVAEIGDTIESHLRAIGLMKVPEMDDHRKAMLAEKRARLHAQGTTSSRPDDFPETARFCTQCHTRAVVLIDGCMTCLSCGDSKCG
uniref:ribonucleoside-diphosphate reductase n=1 Tax=Candidatus Kentrum sp. SD TaxID=2126332 RepID=A0A451BQT9_9GAMM|nr:MAG: TSCPD domain-containing protein [Candidatus Kentron sp. SD]